MECNLANLFEIAVDAYPDREYLVANGKRRTYAEMEARANQLAHHLAAQGIGPGDHVGIYAYNSVEWVETLWAVFKLRAVWINVNYRYVKDELHYLLTNADLKALVHQREFSPLVGSLLPDLRDLRHVIVVEDGTDVPYPSADAVGYEDALAGQSTVRDFGPRSADDIYILYTGGTTGMPKGVLWRHEDAFFACMGGGDPSRPEITSVRELIERIAPEPTTFLALAPLMHAAGGWTVMIYLLAGNRAVLWPGPLDPAEVWRTIEREAVTATSAVGDAVLRPLLDAWDSFDPKPDLGSLRLFSSGGAPLSPAVRERFLATFPTLPLSDGYGSSETGIQAGRVFVGPTGDGPEPQFVARQAVVMDEETHEPVPPGSTKVGRVARTGRIPLGYYNDPEKSAATFVEWDGRRWSLTGDMGTVAADGTISLLGRGSICINTGGEKVYPEEVEAVLRRSDSVYDVVVVGAPDERWGQRVVAVVEPTPGTDAAEDDLRELARKYLAGFKVPKAVVFVEHIVRSPSGKADYRWAAGVAAGD